MKNRFASIEEMDVDSDADDENIAQNNAGVDSVERNETITEGDDNADPYLVESGKILLDMIALQNDQVSLL